jgi:PhzF family phenazine biosynthesis protein
MKTLKIFQVDAFTEEKFKGNPAAVCILEDEIKDESLQAIAREMNLSETAFVKVIDGKSFKDGKTFSLRWFTPNQEVPLCGHATLATLQVIFEHYNNCNKKLNFQTKSGDLVCEKTLKGISLNFPLDNIINIVPENQLLEAMGIKDFKDCIIGENTRKVVVKLNSIKEVLELKPNYEKMKTIAFKTDIKGVGVTCEGDGNYDFISRYFNPWAGINEDSVTGSVHTLLANYWKEILNKNTLKAYQASERGGEILLNILNDDRVELIGKAVIVLKGEIYAIEN